MSDPLASYVLPSGIRTRVLPGINGLDMHVLEAGYETPGRPCVLLLHGFPELAYSWRKIMGPLAAAGYHIVAPDQRGYGRTTGWNADYDADPASFRLFNIVRDTLGLVDALGYSHVAAVAGHDFGSPVAAWCGLLRPDIFRRVALMSAPFAGPPSLTPPNMDAVHAELARLEPPRKHYQWYYSTRQANENMHGCPQGLHDFLRAYFHVKSADWPQNRPSPLMEWTAKELARLPRYYIMDLDVGMAETVARDMPSRGQIGACRWLPDHELAVYANEFQRTGFQGGLRWYRCRTERHYEAEMQIFAGRKLEVPTLFISGKSDWGVYQVPGSFEKMQSVACLQWRGVHLIDGAGHWVQQEQPERVTELLLEFLQQERRQG